MLKNRSVFRKAMRNVRNRSDIKFLTAEKRSSNLISQPNYNTTKNFSEKLLVIWITRKYVKMNKSRYLSLSILDTSKIAIYEYWYVKPEYEKKG